MLAKRAPSQKLKGLALLLRIRKEIALANVDRAEYAKLISPEKANELREKLK